MKLQKTFRNLFAVFAIGFVLCTALPLQAEKIFTPTKEGIFKAVDMPDDILCSANNIGEFCGYPNPKFYSYDVEIEEGEYVTILFKAFSTDIIAVHLPYDADSDILPRKTLNVWLKDFDYAKEFDPYNRKETLNEAIEEGSFNKEFMCEVLHLPYSSYAQSNTITDKKHGYKYKFNSDGILESYTSVDGLDYRVKDTKETNPKMFAEWDNYLRQYWGKNQKGYVDEFNAQMKAFWEIPEGMQNIYLELVAIRGDYVYNFFVLDMVLNARDETLANFKKYTHGGAKLISARNTPVGKILTYRYKHLDLLFDGDGAYIGLPESEDE